MATLALNLHIYARPCATFSVARFKLGFGEFDSERYRAMADHSRNASDGGYQYPRGYQYPQTEYQLQNVNPNSGDWEPVVPKRYTPSPPRPPSVESENTLLKKRDPGVVSEEVEEIQGDPRGRRLPGELRRSSAIVLGEAVWKFFAVCCGIVFVAYGFIILSLHDKAPDPILRTALEAAAKYVSLRILT